MQNENEEVQREERDERPGDDVPVEVAEHPIPGIKHEEEPDAENIMPAEDQPGTF